jgi:hypothetical protein
MWRLFLCVMLLTVCGCGAEPPPIANGIAISYGPTAAFTGKLAERFPVGSSAPDLLKELYAEKFHIQTIALSSRLQYMAVYEITRFPCKDKWTVDWEVEAQRITMIKGQAVAICL